MITDSARFQPDRRCCLIRVWSGVPGVARQPLWIFHCGRISWWYRFSTGGAGPGVPAGTEHEQQGTDRETAEQADREVAAQMLVEAARIDAAEDAVCGPARGGELPPQWPGREGHREWICATHARLGDSLDPASSPAEPTITELRK
jgi:hypothetical protein